MKLADIINDIKANAYATFQHSGQTRKFSGDAYIKHPRRVANRIKRWGESNPDIIAAAYLHDVIEDTGASYQDVKRYFNQKVADIVDWVTNKGDKTEHIRRMMSSAPYGALVIKTFDRIDNLNDNPNPAFLAKNKETTEIILDGLKNRGFGKLHQELLKAYLMHYTR